MINAEQAQILAIKAVIQDIPSIIENILEDVEYYAKNGYGNYSYSSIIAKASNTTYAWNRLHSSITKEIRHELEKLGFYVERYSDELKISW